MQQYIRFIKVVYNNTSRRVKDSWVHHHIIFISVGLTVTGWGRCCALNFDTHPVVNYTSRYSCCRPVQQYSDRLECCTSASHAIKRVWACGLKRHRPIKWRMSSKMRCSGVILCYQLHAYCHVVCLKTLFGLIHEQLCGLTVSSSWWCGILHVISKLGSLTVSRHTGDSLIQSQGVTTHWGYP